MIFDARGKLLAQGAASVPSFTGTGFHTLGHVIDRIKPSNMRDGDIIVTNDPWMGTGHTYDINVVKPVFHRGKIVGYCLTYRTSPTSAVSAWDRLRRTSTRRASPFHR